MPGTPENPLLEPHRLPPFSRIRPEHVMPALEEVLGENRRRIAELETARDWTWRGLADPMEGLSERLRKVWAPVRHLHAVADEAELRAAYGEGIPRLAAYYTEVGQNEILFRGYQALANGPEYARLDHARRRVVDLALREFRLAGVGLPPQSKARFMEISKRLSELSSRFEENLLDATMAWKKPVTEPGALAGLPEAAMELAAETARREGLEGWLLTLEFPSYYAAITYADDPELRREVYEAYNTRASDRGPHAGRWDNTPLLAGILELRREQAALLDYDSYAELSLERKMAPSTQAVLEFIRDLARRARPRAQAELEELRDYACGSQGAPRLEPWDLAYYSEKLREDKHRIAQESLRPWFPVPMVLAGLFEICRCLYGLDIRGADGVETWHPDVRFFRIRDAEGELRGELYLDLHARPSKRGGAWLDGCVVRTRRAGAIQAPAAFLTCNFTPPVAGRPALLTHDEVVTLFHEFGHALHHLLTRMEHPSVAGINGVPWDAVELPSQLMENWCWEGDAMELVSGHHETGERLPGPMFERLRAARHFQSGMQMLRQLEFALFDFLVHMEDEPGASGRAQVILDQVRREIAVVTPPSWSRFAQSFSHVFGGAYAAGYYSYKWAELLSADAFSKFEAEGVFHRPTGREFMESVLEQGGSRDAMELFVEFRGREPRMDALLRHSGLEPAAADLEQAS